MLGQSLFILYGARNQDGYENEVGHVAKNTMCSQYISRISDLGNEGYFDQTELEFF